VSVAPHNGQGTFGARPGFFFLFVLFNFPISDSVFTYQRAFFVGFLLVYSESGAPLSRPFAIVTLFQVWLFLPNQRGPSPLCFCPPPSSPVLFAFSPNLPNKSLSFSNTLVANRSYLRRSGLLRLFLISPFQKLRSKPMNSSASVKVQKPSQFSTAHLFQGPVALPPPRMASPYAYNPP